MTKPRLDQGVDYERGFIDGMQKQMQSSVDKAVNRMAQPKQEPLACKRCKQLEEQAYDLLGELKVANIKLSMQPQRTWVGLTAKEKHEFRYSHMTTADFIDAIEAKLKDKNL